MASAKDIKKKIRSVSNTRKITRTMEMVATVKSKRGQDRRRALVPYSDTIFAMFRSLLASGDVSHPLLGPATSGTIGTHAVGAASEASGESGKNLPTLLLVVTGNRGLCGGYNANVLHLAERFIEEEAEAGRRTDVYMIGKKGIARFRFRKIPMVKTNVSLGDNPSFQEASDLAEELTGRFLSGEAGRVAAVATIYESASIHKPAKIDLLPLRGASVHAADPAAQKALESQEVEIPGAPAPEKEFLFEPDRQTVLDALIPLAVRMAVFRIIVEARTSEHIARRVAMKMATDNAEQMIRTFTVRYNRQRQAGITQQIVEIVSGAEALE